MIKKTMKKKMKQDKYKKLGINPSFFGNIVNTRRFNIKIINVLKIQKFNPFLLTKQDIRGKIINAMIEYMKCIFPQ